MMADFFTWISQMSRLEAFSYAILVALVMGIIPYSTFLYMAIQKIVLWKKMKVIHFGYSFYPNLVRSTSVIDSNFELLPENNFILEGSPVILKWQIEGAIQVRLLPGIGKVKGNAAEVLVSRNRRHFSLEVKGLFSKQILQVEIPLDKIKTLETSDISEFKVETYVEKVTSYSITQSALFTNSLIRSLPVVKQLVNVSLNATRKLIIKRPLDIQKSSENANNIVSRQKLVKSYSFSTKKYNKYNQFKTINTLSNE
jgi:hypothetical protein